MKYPVVERLRSLMGNAAAEHRRDYEQLAADAIERILELEAALRPFAESHVAECVGDDGWTTTIHRESISTWFGPSDFRAARAAINAAMAAKG